MITPVQCARNAIVLMATMSGMMSRDICRGVSLLRVFLRVWKYNMSPNDPSVNAGENTGISFLDQFSQERSVLSKPNIRHCLHDLFPCPVDVSFYLVSTALHLPAPPTFYPISDSTNPRKHNNCHSEQQDFQSC